MEREIAKLYIRKEYCRIVEKLDSLVTFDKDGRQDIHFHYFVAKASIALQNNLFQEASSFLSKAENLRANDSTVESLRKCIDERAPTPKSRGPYEPPPKSETQITDNIDDLPKYPDDPPYGDQDD